MTNTNIKVNDDGTISPIDPSKPSSYTPKPQGNTLDEIDNKIDDLLLQFTKGYGALTVTFSGNLGDNARVFQLPYNVLREAIKLLVLDERQVTEALITEAEDKLLIRIAEKTNKEYDWSEVDNWIFAYGSDLRDVYINRKLYKQLKEDK